MRPHCAFCCLHPGWIVAGWEHNGVNTQHLAGDPVGCDGCYEVMAPCPFCDHGRTVEYSVFSEAGYWRGEAPTPSEVEESCRCHERPMSKQVGLQRIDQMKVRLKQHFGDTEQRRRQTVREQLDSASTVIQAVTSPPVRLDTMPVQNGSGPVQDDDDEIGTLL